MLTRHLWLLVHRYAGLLMACFLILVGLTGSLLAFRPQIDRLLAPRFYAKPQRGMARLDFAALTDRAEALVPQGQVCWIIARDDQISIALNPRQNPATGKPYNLDLAWLYLNPWDGRELARLKPGDPDPAAVTTTILRLHEALLLDSAGRWVLGIIALLWTIDCFVSFYLTLPAAIARFWQRWKLAWQVKWRASAFRVNFDLHRASGLWLWPALFVFAWSSVMFNVPAVYTWVTGAIFDYQPPIYGNVLPNGGGPPRMDFRTALSTAQRLMAEQGAKHGFSVGRPNVFVYQAGDRNYFYNVDSSRDIYDQNNSYTTITFDADTGAMRSLNIPTGEHTGSTISNWLTGLHEVWVFGLPYRIFVCMLGLVIAMLSYTGVYIWWKKRLGRKLAARTQRASFTKVAVQPEGGAV